MIFYLDIVTNAFVYAGNDPIKEDLYIPINSRNYELSIKYRKPQTIDERQKKQQEENKNIENRRESRYVLPSPIIPENNSKKRIKERYIKDVIDKVNLWRNLHKEGWYDNQKNCNVHLSLDAAAQKVGISKKTLDDYLFQIR